MNLGNYAKHKHGPLCADGRWEGVISMQPPVYRLHWGASLFRFVPLTVRTNLACYRHEFDKGLKDFTFKVMRQNLMSSPISPPRSSPTCSLWVENGDGAGHRSSMSDPGDFRWPGWWSCSKVAIGVCLAVDLKGSLQRVKKYALGYIGVQTR